ncbi:MAG: hypothetical protein JWN86_1234 [Planctomycetota bacterium]|nr:hypothetical protein [Planctomycetota bacterium]
MKVRASRLRRRVALWAQRAATPLDRRLTERGWEQPFVTDPLATPLRPRAGLRRIRAWERRYGYSLPAGLRTWLAISDGLYGADGPLIHPLTAIGPMIPFASVPDLVVQPESWFELGNPGRETVCIDLGYRWPGGDCPIFVSGDDERGTSPRLVAPSFDAWFVRLLAEGGREYWFDSDFVSLGDPWAEHRHHAPKPPLSERLMPLAPRVLPLMHPGADDRSIATMLGVTRGDVEAIFRHLQHAAGP